MQNDFGEQSDVRAKQSLTIRKNNAIQCESTALDRKQLRKRAKCDDMKNLFVHNPSRTYDNNRFLQLRSKSHALREQQYYSREYSLLDPKTTNIVRCTRSLASNCNGYILSTEFKRLFRKQEFLGKEVSKYLNVRPLNVASTKPATSSTRKIVVHSSEGTYIHYAPRFLECSKRMVRTRQEARQSVVLKNNILLQKLKAALTSNPKREMEIVLKVSW
jgi:hypothetical protein